MKAIAAWIVVFGALSGCGGGGGSAGGGYTGGTASYSIGGMVSGLTAAGLVLADNSGDKLSVAANATTFAFATPMSSGGVYAVTVATQPAGQICTVTSGSGTASAAVTSVTVVCVVQTFSVGGTLTGLTGAGLVLADNGGDKLPVAANATTFTFATPVTIGGAYAVTVATPPTGQSCTVTSGTGTANAAVTSVTVACVVQTFSVGGTVAGLTGAGLVLADNGGDKLSVAANATTFTFATPVPFGGAYAITVATSPTGQVCTVTSGSGAVNAKVATVLVTCVPTFTLGGSVSGLASAAQLVLVNGTASNSVTILGSGNGTFSFPTATPYGGSYAVSVRTQPPAQTCNVINGSGSGVTADVSNIGITCNAAQETVLYSFQTVPDGSSPAGLIQGSDGNLYGVAQSGGTNTLGTIFRVTPAGAETVLHSFQGVTDGGRAYGRLTQGSDSNIYGTTPGGGATFNGSVYKITPGGVKSLVYSFQGGADGSDPDGSLLQASDGNFYGATKSGGAPGFGTIFKVTPLGEETVLYSFLGGADGASPGPVIQGGDGNFYGITEGGASNFGTVFMLTPGGVKTSLYTFQGSADGSTPIASLLQGSDGDFYGVTYAGGASGNGTVYKVTVAGVKTTLHSFQGSPDGASPVWGLTQANDGNFYATTIYGGTLNQGAIYSISPQGVETVLYSFGLGSDGLFPNSPLILGSDGVFYGVTTSGGVGFYFDGTVFKF